MFKALWLDHGWAKQRNWGWTPDSRMPTSLNLHVTLEAAI